MVQIKRFIYFLFAGFSPLRTYLAINITNLCNRSCVFCPYHSKTLTDTEHTRWFRSQPDHIDTNRLYELINRLPKFMVNHIAITGKGEPMLHPEFLRICSIVDRSGIPWSVTTNGDKMKPSMCDHLRKFSNLKSVRVSVYDVELLSFWLNKAKHSPLPITLYNQTGHHFDGMVDGYTCYVDGNKRHSMPKDFNNSPCRTPFSFLTLNTDGSVVPCYSYNGIGTWSDSFWKLWNGKDIRKFRRDALSMKATMADCKNCGGNL